jgi:hypothetical protein
MLEKSPLKSTLHHIPEESGLHVIGGEGGKNKWRTVCIVLLHIIDISLDANIVISHGVTGVRMKE